MDNRSRPEHAVILAGGASNAADVRHPGMPLPLIPFQGRPFLAHKLEALAALGIRQVHLTAHYRRREFEDYLTRAPDLGLEIDFLGEERALGSGGSLLRFARQRNLSGNILVTFGNRFIPCVREDLNAARGEGTFFATETGDAACYPTFATGADGALAAIHAPRPVHAPAAIFAGMAIIPYAWLDGLTPADAPLRFERDLVPAWLGQGKVLRMAMLPGPFVDLRIPEALEGVSRGFAAAGAQPAPA